MIQRGQDLSLALEPGQPLRVRGHRCWQHFDGDRPLQVRVGGLVDLAHAASPKRGEDLVRAEASAGGERHYRFSPASQFWTIVMGGAVASSTATFMRNRPSVAMSYCAAAVEP